MDREAHVKFRAAHLLASALAVSGCSPNGPPKMETQSSAEAVSDIWSQIEIARKDCDDSAGRMTASLKAKNITDAAAAVGEAEATCLKASSAIGRITPPPLIDVSASDALNSAVIVCKKAYQTRSGAYRQLANNLTGENVDPSSAELKRRLVEANDQAALCAKDFHNVAFLTGASLGD